MSFHKVHNLYHETLERLSGFTGEEEPCQFCKKEYKDNPRLQKKIEEFLEKLNFED
jgi:hypothetical protein